MYYLGLDTTNKYLIISIFTENETLYFEAFESFRNVSELANFYIEEAFKSLKLSPKDLEAVVVCKGPGSFTGVRIGMSIAKVLTSTLDIPMYTISSMNFYSGLTSNNILLDARSKKVYFGSYDSGQVLHEKLVDMSEISDDIVNNSKGDLSLFELDDNYTDLNNNFLKLKEFWLEESSLDAKPLYIKSNL